MGEELSDSALVAGQGTEPLRALDYAGLALLAKRPELTGKLVQLTSYDTSSSRWVCKLASGVQILQPFQGVQFCCILQPFQGVSATRFDAEG